MGNLGEHSHDTAPYAYLRGLERFAGGLLPPLHVLDQEAVGIVPGQEHILDDGKHPRLHYGRTSSIVASAASQGHDTMKQVAAR